MADFSSLKQTIQTYIKQNGNEEITGNILQDVLLAMVSTMGDSAINGLASALQDETNARQNQDGNLQGNITAEATARRDADTALGGRIDGLQTAINGINTKLAEGYIYAGIATPSTNPGTPSGKVFYIAVSSGTYTNFSNLTAAQGINILKYNGSAWSKDVVYAIDARPKKASQNLVTSGGVFDNIGALDVSELNATENPHTLAKYTDLSSAIAAIPTDYQKGGMSIKYVHTSDNKYVQYRFMLSGSFTLAQFVDVANWQGDYPFCYSNSGAFNEVVKELYVPTTLVDWSTVIGIRVFKADLVDNKYLIGFSIYTDSWHVCYLSFDTEQEALDYCSSNIKYGNMYAVFDWSKVPTGRTNFTLALKKYVADYNYSPAIKEEILSLNNVTDSDLTVDVVSNNIANPENVEVGRYVKNNGSFANNASWAMIKVPVTAGEEYTVAGFTVGRNTMPIAYYNDDTLVQAGLTIANPQGTTNPTTLTVPSGANLLYIDIASDDLVPADYSYIQINVGDELLSYDVYKEAITKINSIPLVGEGGSTEGMSTIVMDLPVSDGTDIQSGYAYIDSTDRSVKVKA